MGERSHPQAALLSPTVFRTKASEIPSILLLRNSLGYGRRNRPEDREFIQDVTTYILNFSSSHGIPGHELTSWKNEHHQQGLIEITEKFLDYAGKGLYYWPDEPLAKNSKVLQYSRNHLEIKIQMLKLFFKIALHERSQKKRHQRQSLNISNAGNAQNIQSLRQRGDSVENPIDVDSLDDNFSYVPSKSSDETANRNNNDWDMEEPGAHVNSTRAHSSPDVLGLDYQDSRQLDMMGGQLTRREYAHEVVNNTADTDMRVPEGRFHSPPVDEPPPSNPILQDEVQRIPADNFINIEERIEPVDPINPILCRAASRTVVSDYEPHGSGIIAGIDLIISVFETPGRNKLWGPPVRVHLMSLQRIIDEIPIRDPFVGLSFNLEIPRMIFTHNILRGDEEEFQNMLVRFGQKIDAFQSDHMGSTQRAVFEISIGPLI